MTDVTALSDGNHSPLRAWGSCVRAREGARVLGQLGVPAIGNCTLTRPQYYNQADKQALRRSFMTRKRKKLRGTVAKVIKSPHPSQPEKAEINIKDADDLYREIRVDNELTDDTGEKASLKPGAEVDVIVEADSGATLKKPSASEKSERKD